jgi:hypothetical protein
VFSHEVFWRGVRDDASETKGIAEAKEWKTEAMSKVETVNFMMKIMINMWKRVFFEMS